MTELDPLANRKRSATPAIAKVVLVVEALALEHRLTGIARRTGLPASTVHRVLRELTSLGWVRESDEHDYDLGARLLSLVSRVTDESDVVRAARPILQDLCERTGRTIHLGLREGDRAVYVEKLDGRQTYQMRSRIGLPIPLHSTAIGKALLAQLSDGEIRAIAERTGLPAYTARTITDVARLLTKLRQVRALGFAVDDEENEVHTRCIGAVVFDHRGVPVGGLSLSSLAFDLDADHVRQYAPLVVKAARDVSAALGAATEAVRPSPSTAPLPVATARPKGR